MTGKKKAQKKTGGKGSAPEAAEDVVTVERIYKLVDIIVPEAGCTGNNADAVALALNELVTTLTHPDTKYDTGEDGAWFADFVAERAFQKTGRFSDALEDWRDGIFEGALKKGGE